MDFDKKMGGHFLCTVPIYLSTAPLISIRMILLFVIIKIIFSYSVGRQIYILFPLWPYHPITQSCVYQLKKNWVAIKNTDIFVKTIFLLFTELSNQNDEQKAPTLSKTTKRPLEMLSKMHTVSEVHTHPSSKGHRCFNVDWVAIVFVC